MPSLLSRIRSAGAQPERGLLDMNLLQAQAMGYGGLSYPLGMGGLQLTQKGERVSTPTGGLGSYANELLKQHGPTFALVSVRQMTFSTIDLKFQRRSDRELFGTPALRTLERPWPGGTTQNLLASALVDVDLTGNFYAIRHAGEIVRLSPDLVDHLLVRRPIGGLTTGAIRYWPDGRGGDPVDYAPDEVCHFAPQKDPTAPWRGMSWLTPVLREIGLDKAAGAHAVTYFEQAATPNLAVSLAKEVPPEKFQKFVDQMDDAYSGAGNAGKTMYLGGGADVTVVGANLQQLDLATVQGGLETRMASAAGVPPAIVGFREGNQGSALNASTYGQQRRKFAHATLWPLWADFCGSVEAVVDVPDGARVWFDTAHTPLLHEDATDSADILNKQMAAIRQGVDGGFDPDAVVTAVTNGDLKQLAGAHSGLTSVQLVPPGSDQANSIRIPSDRADELVAQGWTYPLEERHTDG